MRIQQNLSLDKMLVVVQKHALTMTKSRLDKEKVITFFEMNEFDGVMFAKTGPRTFVNRLRRHCQDFNIDAQEYMLLYQAIYQYPKFLFLCLKLQPFSCPSNQRLIGIRVHDRRIATGETILKWTTEDKVLDEDGGSLALKVISESHGEGLYSDQLELEILTKVSHIAMSF